VSGKIREPFGGRVRAEYGAMVQLEHESGAVEWRDLTSPLMDALRALCADLDERPGWKVAVISSPSTIYRDLQGTRSERYQSGGSWKAGDSDGPGDDRLQLPEQALLARIGRLDLWKGAA
jgi:hypothetical protein